MAQASIDEEKGAVVRFSGARARTSALDAYKRPMQEGTGQREAASDTVAFDPDEVALRALISAIGARDESALTALYDATASRVMALALRFTGQHEAAEEVVMDVYLQVWRQWDRYHRARGTVMAWIFTICRSRAPGSAEAPRPGRDPRRSVCPGGRALHRAVRTQNKGYG